MPFPAEVNQSFLENSCFQVCGRQCTRWNVKVAQSCLTLVTPMDCTVHGILQARILEFSSPGDLPNPGTEPRSPAWQTDSLPLSHQESPGMLEWVAYPFSRESSLPRNRTGVSCLNILSIQKAKQLSKTPESEVTQSSLTLCDPMDCNLPGSSVHGIFQGRILEWVAISFFRGSSRPRDPTWFSYTADRLFTVGATGKTFQAKFPQNS